MTARKYYVAVASGGVWKTVNAGTTWTPVFDNEGAYSIGAVALDPKNPPTVWVGTGERNSQRSVGYGDGVYESDDGGTQLAQRRAWKSPSTSAASRLTRVTRNVVYVAAQGPLWSAGRRSRTVQDHRRRQDVEGRARASARTPV